MPENDARLFAALRDMWEQRDPMPEGLVDDVIIALETERLAEEYRQLMLVSDARELAGARGAAPRILEFGAAAVTLLLRIESDGGSHRIDGWLAPPRGGRAELLVGGAEVASATISPEGRFEFPRVAAGICRIVIRSAGEDGYSVTGEFEVD
ncbi:hypothetical protein H4J02_12460 [Protaetiibacter sp. SSC-01]|uniref:hypothetical protein n=1 Tax=Protaetiibacter sp. SSC-01 TaxID=2759943 RepID=UPI0016568FE6|nr:hypothetical protein [Protaetiibacter sp. SSC-01]QNO37240.1 hypothetical protein H4J02_12460 [Protaetiibacter sp. SSC-01]